MNKQKVCIIGAGLTSLVTAIVMTKCGLFVEIIKDKDYVYEALTKDLYYLGIVLNRKYKILRWTYTIFMTGIIISVISFVIAFWLM